MKNSKHITLHIHVYSNCDVNMTTSMTVKKAQHTTVTEGFYSF